MFWFLQVRRPEDGTCDKIVPLGSTLPDYPEFKSLCDTAGIKLEDGFEVSFYAPAAHALARTLNRSDPQPDDWHYCAWKAGSTFFALNGLCKAYL